MAILYSQTTDDGGAEGFNSRQPRGWMFTATGSGVIATVTFKGNAPTTNIKLAIYSDNGSNDRPLAPICESTGSITVVADTLHTFTMTAGDAIVSGTKYHAVFKTDQATSALASNSAVSTPENFSAVDALYSDAFDASWSHSGSATGTAPYLVIESAPSGPTITDVDTDNDVYPGQDAVYTGSGFGPSQGTGTITLTSPSGLTTIDQPESAWSDTGVTAEVVNIDGDSAIPFKTGVTVTLYNDDGTTDTHTITLSPPAGTTVVDVLDPLSDSTSIYQDATPAVATGDETWWQLVEGENVALAANGTLTADSATAVITFRIWDATDETISAEYTATLSDGVVSVGGSFAMILASSRPMVNNMVEAMVQ